MTTPPDFRALCKELIEAHTCYMMMGPYDQTTSAERYMRLINARGACTEALNTPLITPIPVSERPILKSDPFNDAQGRCWCGTTEFIDEHGDRPVPYPCSWELREPCAQDDCLLPHWAIPLPEEL